MQTLVAIEYGLVSLEKDNPALIKERIGDEAVGKDDSVDLLFFGIPLKHKTIPLSAKLLVT